MELATLTALPDETGTQVPVFSGHVTVTVSCKEGGTLKGQMYTWFPMTKVGGAWLMMDTHESSPATKFTME